MAVSYTKSQRSQAKQEKSGLFTIDTDDRVNGEARVTLSGLASKKRMKKLRKILRRFIAGE